MPEQLQARGISWKVYGSPDGNFGDNVLPYFKQYQTNPTLAANALDPDLSRALPGRRARWARCPRSPGCWPRCSTASTRPLRTSTARWSAANVLNTLVSNPAVWAKTALFVTYDENGGFFDHVPPPTAAARGPPAST